MSFVPDGTATGTGPSNLFQSMSSLGNWQMTVLKAAQTWAVNSNINVGLVPDGGQALGTFGTVQSDPRFGDIRLAASPMPPTSLANAIRPNWTGSTFNGDVVLNGAAWTPIIGPIPDLYTIALHEFGHSFGLDDEPLTADSVMAEAYTGPRDLAPSDVANLQALYGVRSVDSYDAALANETRPAATTMFAYAWDADITTPGDVDWYRVTVPLTALLGDMKVTLETNGVSLLAGKLELYNSAGTLISSSAASSPLSPNATLTNPGVFPGTTYYLRVSGNRPDVFGLGGYRIRLEYSSLAGTITGIASSLVHHIGGLLNNTFDAATILLPIARPVPDERFDYSYKAGLIGNGDSDYYRLQAPTGQGQITLHALAWGIDVNGLQPMIQAYDANQQPLPVQVMGNSAGMMSIEVAGITAGAVYYLQVLPQNAGDHDSGNYTLGVKFDWGGPSAPALIDSATVSATMPRFRQLTLTQNQVLQFRLASSFVNATDTGNMVQFTVFAQDGTHMMTLTARPGRPLTTMAVLLKAGRYNTYVTHVSDGQGTALTLHYSLSSLLLSDPIGPYRRDTTSQSTNPPVDDVCDVDETPDDLGLGSDQIIF